MPEPIQNYDVVILGGGPAGFIAASAATEAHKTVALVDCHRELGGAGINTGTVPSKTLRETALALSGVRSRSLYGVDLSLRREVTVADFLGHEQHVKAGFNAIISERLHSRKAAVHFGDASFVDPHTVRVRLLPSEQNPDGGEVLLRGETILIATGSSPVHPPLFPFGDTEVYDSDTLLKIDRIPKSLAVVGAGVIGSEYACTFTALGTKVHIIDGRDVLLPFLDCEVSRALVTALERSGIVFDWKETVTACTAKPSREVELVFASGKKLTVDAVLVAAGRQSNTAALALDKAGVATGKRGVITVDADYRTNVPHIYAAGDVIGFPALASTSMAQARMAMTAALSLPPAKISPLLPNGIYTIPEVSMVGETEESLKEKGVDYVAGRAPYLDNARGQIIGDVDGFLKLLFDRQTMKLLGIHVIGEQATELVHIGLIAMMAGGGGELFLEACFNIPTLGALYKTATLNALENKKAKPAS